MDNKKILITGTDGFIGGILKDFFIDNGWEVYGTAFFRDPVNTNEIKIDISKPEEFSKLWKSISFKNIIHTAAIIDDTKPLDLLISVNADGTKSMCEYAKSHGCKHFIQLSSVAVYGNKVVGENVIESKNKRQIKSNTRNYGKAKAMAEENIEESGLEYTILRLPIVLGSKDSFVTPSIVPRLQNGTLFTCGKEKHNVSLLYVKNLGSIIQRLIEVGPLNGCFNCGSHDVSWDEFIEEFATNLNLEYNPEKKEFMEVMKEHGSDPNIIFIAAYSSMGARQPSDKLFKRLGGWSPSFDWREGVKEALKEYIENKKK